MSSSRVLPDCLVIGPQKAGTSWIARYLEERGDIVLPRGVKETFYFDRRYEAKQLDWYAAHFRHRTVQHRLCVEVAPTYFHDPLIPQRVGSTLGRPKLVCTLRDPVKRAFSLYLHMLRYGITNKPLQAAVESHPEILASSRYADCLQRWFDVFGEHSILVLDQETLASDPAAFVGALCQYLELPEIETLRDLKEKVNEAAVPRHFLVSASGRIVGDALRSFRLYSIIEFAKRLGLKRLFFGKPYGAAQPQLSPENRLWLSEKLAGEVDQVERLLGRTFSAWNHSEKTAKVMSPRGLAQTSSSHNP